MPKGILLKKAREIIGDNTLFLFNTQYQDPNFVYLADIPPGFENNALFVNKSKFIHLNRGMEQTRAEKYSLAKAKAVDSIFGYVEKNLTGKLLINGRFLPWAAYKRLRKYGKVIDFSKELSGLRILKTKEEISRIRRAKKLSLDSFKKADLTATETEIRKQIEYNYEPAYSSIVAADKNSSFPHYFPGNYAPKRLLMLDFGARYKNRVCDLTRMHYANPTKEMKKVHAVVKEAQAAAKDAAAPGITAGEITKAAYGIIRKAGYGKNILHALGHGIGAQVHEAPLISEASKTVLAPGMVFTIEPGIYTKTFGVRIEDDFVITKNGCKLI